MDESVGKDVLQTFKKSILAFYQNIKHVLINSCWLDGISVLQLILQFQLFKIFITSYLIKTKR